MSFARVCVCEFRRQQRLLSCICCWPTLFIYILFHFILFHFMLAFFCSLLLLLLLSRAGVMNCFTYTLNMQHMFLAVDALNIYMQSLCPFCGTFIVTLSVCLSVCVCVFHKLLSAYCRWCRIFQMRPTLECGGT